MMTHKTSSLNLTEACWETPILVHDREEDRNDNICFDRDFNPIKAFRIYSTLRFKNHLKEATNTNPFVSYITEAFARRPQLQLHVVDG